MGETGSSAADRRRRAQGRLSDEIQERTAQLDEQYPEWAAGFVFGDVWGRPGLDHDTRMLVAIAQLAATGHHTALRAYLRGALESGIPTRRMHETLVMTVVYCGFPTLLESLVTWHEVLGESGRALDDDADPEPADE